MTQALDTASIEALLAKHHVATLRIALPDGVSFQPVDYVYADHWVYARLEDGPDLAEIDPDQWVVMAVNEVEGIYDWRLVTANGSLELLGEEPAAPRGAACREALDRLRAVVPEVGSPDAMPERVQLVRLRVDKLAGREARGAAALL